MAVATKKEGHREALLKAALTCLREKGYARTTARDLVAASGTNLASIGYHYGSKEALLNEAILAGFRTWTEEVERATFGVRSATGLERLELSLAAMIDRFEELRPFLVSFVEAFPQAIRSPELRARMAESYAEARAAGTEMVLRAVAADGQSLPREHAETIASLTTAVCDGLMLQWLLDPEAVPSSHDVMAALGTAGPIAAAGRGATPGPVPNWTSK